MSLTDYVTLGRSGLRVSPLSLGAMTFGEEAGFGSNADVSKAILDRYIDQGGNFIDTANGYNKGHSEKIIGDHVGHIAEKRDRLVIATKFSSNLHFGDPNGGGSNRKSIIAAAEHSLRRLRTDYIDLYWLHNWDKHTPIEETVAAMHDLVQSGKVRYVGISDTPAWKVSQAQVIALVRGWAPFIGLQIEYSLLQRTVEGELVPMAQELGLGVTPWSPLADGVLSGKYTRENASSMKGVRSEILAAQRLNDRTFATLDVIRRMAGELDTTMARVSLAWVRSRPGVSSTIIGARTMEQLDDNLGSLDVVLTDEQIAELDSLTEPQLSFPIPFLRAAAAAIHQGGTTINGVPGPTHFMMPSKAGDHY